MKLKGRKSVQLLFIEPESGFKSGHNYTKLHIDSEHLGQFIEAEIEFYNNVLTKIYKFIKKLIPIRARRQTSSIEIEKIQINFMSHIDKRYKSLVFYILLTFIDYNF